MKNGEKYESIYARAAAYFLATCAERPASPTRAAAYNFITGIYKNIMENPESVGWKPAADVWFEPWEQQRERQKDVKTIREAIDKVERLVSELFDLATAADADEDSLVLNDGCKKPSRALAKALGGAVEGGRICLPNGCAAGLKELSKISRENVIPITDGPKEDKEYLYFSRCVFEPSDNWAAAAFDRGLDAGGQLLWLCAELEKRGYKRIDCKDGKRVSLDYVKTFGKKDAPVKISWADKIHYGIELTTEDLRLEPYFLWLRMPAFKSVLERSSELPSTVAEFITSSTKSCDGCRYCVQTDKTGTRPLAAVAVNGRKKCPYYPSFTMNWRSLTPERAQAILAVLDTVYDNTEQ